MSLPELFGPYLLHHRLTRSLTSEVYLAQTTGEFPRVCAVKRILPERATSAVFQARFRQDAALLVRMIHGNLVHILELGVVEEWPFVAMEHVDGINLQTLISQVPEQGPLPSELALYLGIELCEATSYIHLRRREETGSDHFPPDASWPLEVMLAFDGVVKIIDLGSFGAVGLGAQPISDVFSNPGYSVPEVILKRPLDIRTDLFALGLTMWETLEGKTLVSHDPEEYIRQVLSGKWNAPLVERKDVAGDIIRLISQLLSLDPEKRPSNTEEVRRRLVEGLRRQAPSYGSSSLSQLLWRRCPTQIGQSETRLSEIIQHTQTEPVPSPLGKTQTYGRAPEVVRNIVPAKPLQTGDLIPGTRYREVRLMGQGGYAEVHAAQHIDLDRQVAIKILSPQFASDHEAIVQFRMEARACSRIKHPNIVEVIDFGELEDGRFYFAMELLEGKNLGEVLSQEETLAPERAIGIFRQITKALQAAHDQDIIHRDLKPENIMLVTKDGHEDFVKVLDFGVMAFTHDTRQERVGTKGYMAPEQVRGEKPTPATDIYALGTVLYEALAGELPYPADRFETFAKLQASSPPPALRSRPRSKQIPVSLERVVQRALERSPAARHPSMADFEADLIKAQREAKITTTWDDLSLPAKLRDSRQTLKFAEIKQGSRPAMRWLKISLLVAITGITAVIGAKLYYQKALKHNDSPLNVLVKKSIIHDSSAVPAHQNSGTISPGLQKLLHRVEIAAQQGHFTKPSAENALDLLRQIEKIAPEQQQTAIIRRRIASMLTSASEQLTSAGLQFPAALLLNEARLFDPSTTPSLSTRDNKNVSVFSMKNLTTSGKAAETAWLIAQINQLKQTSGAMGTASSANSTKISELIKRLKHTSVSPEIPAKVRNGNASALSQLANTLWNSGAVDNAILLYQLLLIINPNDKWAQKRIHANTTLTKHPVSTVVHSPMRHNNSMATSIKSVPNRALIEQHIAEGRRLLNEAKLGEARQKFLAALKENSQSASAIVGLAAVAFEQAQYSNTIELSNRAIALDRRQVQAHLLLGDAYFKLLRHADAQKAWTEVLKLDPKNRSAIRRMEKLKNAGS